MDRLDVAESGVQHALSSPAKCRILAACIRRAMPIKDISNVTHQPLASTYRQVKSLLADGVLAVERSAMTSEGKPYDLYRSRIRAARLEITPDRVHATWQPNG